MSNYPQVLIGMDKFVDNPALVFIVMEREKLNYGQAKTFIDETVNKIKLEKLKTNYGL